MRPPAAPPRGLTLAIAAALAGSAAPANALSFGSEQVASYLGQPFVATIPLLGSSSDALEARCFRLSHTQRNDGVATLLNGRVELQTSTRSPTLVVRSARAIDDPVISFAVESVCDAPIRREYTVLLDPPPVRATPISPPTSAASATAGSNASSTGSSAASTPATTEGATAARSAAGTDGATGNGRNRDVARDGSRSATKSTAATPPKHTAQPAAKPAPGKRSADSAAPTPARTVPSPAGDRLRVQAAADASGAPIADASLAALAIPRLRISSDLSAPQPPGANAVGAAAPTDELGAAIAKDRRARLLAAPIEEDLAPRLEADLVVARRRLAEMQAQLTAAGGTPATVAAPATAPAAAAATDSTKKPTAAPAPAADAGWDWLDWIWVPAVALVAGLLAFLFRQRRVQREQKRFAAEPPITIVQTTAADTRFTGVATATTTRTVADPQFAQTTTRFPATAPQTLTQSATFPITHTQTQTQTQSEADRTAQALSEASERLNNPLFQPSDTASHVDVSELSQATDEAQVYADLGRNEQAIEILRAHIDGQTGERTSPAPWLMIFDLYRRTNNRAGYDQLAPLFRKRFNGRMPDWETYGHELALDDGLEAFPHLVARLERTWGTPDARKFLEDLLYDNRGGSRLGFSLAAYRDILLLLQLHDTLASEPNPLDAVDWESRGANDSDGTPKWDLSLDMVEPPAGNELDDFKRGLPPSDKS